MEQKSDSVLLEKESPEKAAEYLRLAMAKLHELQLPATPVNYGLFYVYVSGKDLNINRKVDSYLERGALTHEDASRLFTRFFFTCGDTMLESLRSELLTTVAEAIGTLVDVAGKTSLSNRELEKHIDQLSLSQTSRDILSAVSSIIHETRHFITESKQLESELINSSKDLKTLKDELANARIEATTDALTGLHNRRGFDEFLKRLLNDRRRSGQGFSMVMADMDHFKDINDNYGHLIGDKVLKAFATLLNSNTRDTDFVARFGGEEFVLVLPDTSMDNAFFVAENIRKAVEKLRVKQAKTGDVIGSITASFGVASHRFEETGLELIDRCDKALYKAKNSGRNKSIKAT